MQIDFHDKTNTVSEDIIDVLQRMMDYTATSEGISDNAEMSINFVTNQEIQELNRNYRQKDQPTDVLSFALQAPNIDEVEIIGEEIPVTLGDIVISIDQAKVQAMEYNHSLQREIGFLAVHGFLHLLGYDHNNEENEKVMFEKQASILSEFGLER